jgi:hypothetical protein
VGNKKKKGATPEIEICARLSVIDFNGLYGKWMYTNDTFKWIFVKDTIIIHETESI